MLIESHIMPRQLAQPMTLSDLEWPFHASCTISVVAECHVILSSIVNIEVVVALVLITGLGK